MTRSVRALVVAAALAASSLGVSVAPTGAQMDMGMMMDACMVPSVPSYPGAMQASAPMLGMRGGMAHAVSVWATNDMLPQVFNYYRTALAADGFVEASAGISQTMAGAPQGAAAGGELINSLELSKDGRQFVYLAGTSPGFMLAVGCR